MHLCVVEDGNDRKRDDSGGERERARESGMMFGKEGGGQQKSNLQDHIKRYLNLRCTVTCFDSSRFATAHIYSQRRPVVHVRASCTITLARTWKKSEEGSLKILNGSLTFRIAETWMDIKRSSRMLPVIIFVIFNSSSGWETRRGCNFAPMILCNSAGLCF